MHTGPDSVYTGENEGDGTMRRLIIGAVLTQVWAGPVGCREEPPTPPAPVIDAASAPDLGPRTVTVFVAREAQDAGVSASRATEGRSDEEGNEVRLELSFSKLVEARVLLHAYDENNLELGRAKSQNLDQPAGSALEVPVLFNHKLRLAGVHHFNMELIPQKALIVSGDTAGPVELVKGRGKEPPEIRAGRMREEIGPPIRVSLDVAFVSSFEGELQLRAHDVSGTEVGRSGKSAGLEQDAGSTLKLAFVFHETLSAASVESYELFVRGDQGRKNDKRKR
jgi:hypothetical protein